MPLNWSTVDGATAEGLALLAYARQILRLNDEAYACVAQDSAVGTLRVGLPEELMESALPAVLPRFRALYPRIGLRLHCAGAAGVQAALERGELDLILFKHCADAPPPAAALLWREAMVWAAGAAYASPLPSPLPLVLFGDNCAFRLAATAALAGLRHAVRCGLGITVLPRNLLGEGLVEVEVDAGLPELPAAGISLRHAPGDIAPAAARFAALLGEEIRPPRG